MGKLIKEAPKAKIVQKVKRGANAIKKEVSVPVVTAAAKVEVAKRKRMSSKKRRYLKLLKAEPKREEKPMGLKEQQVLSVKKTLKEQTKLSRG